MMIGIAKRKFPVVIPARNWDPQRPSQPTLSLPVEKDASGEPVEILPGMIITLNAAGNAWQIGAGAATASVVAVAQDAWNTWDVAASKDLVGLPCTGNFRIMTPFYKRGEVYTNGTPLTYCLASENVTVTIGTTTEAIKGAVRPAAEGEPVIGYVVNPPAFNPVADTGSKYYQMGNHETANANTELAYCGQLNQDTACISGVRNETNYWIEFDTAFQPAAPTA